MSEGQGGKVTTVGACRGRAKQTVQVCHLTSFFVWLFYVDQETVGSRGGKQTIGEIGMEQQPGAPCLQLKDGSGHCLGNGTVLKEAFGI